jgi:hypothetical protein
MPDDKSSTRVGGRPSFEPSQSQRHMVEAMAGCGVPEADIAIVIGVAPKTLRKHFREELDTGHIKASAKVAGNLYRIATGSGREAVTAASCSNGTRRSLARMWSTNEVSSRDAMLTGHRRYPASTPSRPPPHAHPGYAEITEGDAHVEGLLQAIEASPIWREKPTLYGSSPARGTSVRAPEAVARVLIPKAAQSRSYSTTRHQWCNMPLFSCQPLTSVGT